MKNYKDGSTLIKGRILRLHRYPQENMKTEVMEMTAYEAIMIMLTTLTLIMSIINIVIKLLLYIIENNAKNNYLMSLAKCEVVILFT